jgi:2-keto-3-deoxy-L-rhamnonate aldolase RhmA
VYAKHRILQMLEQNQIPLGMRCFAGDPILIEIMGLTGYDRMMLDSQHSGNNPRAMEPLIIPVLSVAFVPPHRGGQILHR